VIPDLHVALMQQIALWASQRRCVRPSRQLGQDQRGFARGDFGIALGDGYGEPTAGTCPGGGRAVGRYQLALRVSYTPPVRDLRDSTMVWTRGRMPYSSAVRSAPSSRRI
jgi:hypothetical protein